MVPASHRERSGARDPAFAARGAALLAELSDSLGERRDDPIIVAAVNAIADASRLLSTQVTANPMLLLDALDDDLTRGADRSSLFAAAPRCPVDDVAARDALRRFTRREWLRIVVRDLLGMADLATATHELSALADVAITTAIDTTDARDLAVIAMGKLGGDELNYASDVDIVFAHGGDAQSAARAARRVVAFLAEPSAEGIVWRVDTELRPEGPAGPLSRAPGSYESYFTNWAQAWERQAWIKSRFVAGHRGVAEEVLGAAKAFVWDADLDPGAIRTIRDLRARAEQAVRLKQEREVKRGPGGIRDIEFSIQLLQLIHGRHDPSLRSPTTLDALDALMRAGLVGDDDAAHFAEAYRWLRTVEHRLQIRDGRQTHEIPMAAEDREWLARVLGHRDSGSVSATEAFDDRHVRTRASVREIQRRIFHRPILETIAGVTPFTESTASLLEALGFSEPQRASLTIERLTAGLSRSARVMRDLAPLLVDALGGSPDPDLGLIRLAWIADGPVRNPAVVTAIRDSPVAIRRLATLLGSSRVVADGLRRQPEMCRVVTSADIDEARDAADLREGLGRAMALRDDSERALELRRFHRREQLRVAARDLLDLSSVRAVGDELTNIADAALDAALAAGAEALGIDLSFTVIALGRQGGRELSYPSDLDVIFVYEGTGADDAAAADKLAKRLLRDIGGNTPEGVAWEIDTRLRPEGASGPLARSLEGYRRYYEERARLWEFQSLLRARPVAGSMQMGGRFGDLVRPLVHDPDRPPAALGEIASMKARIDAERRAPGEPGLRDLKLCPGGLVDVEFAIQAQQLHHGVRCAAIAVPGTIAALEAMTLEGIVDAHESATLSAAYEWCSQARNRLYLQTGQATDTVPTDPELLEPFARLMGDDDVLGTHRDLTSAAAPIAARLLESAAT